VSIAAAMQRATYNQFLDKDGLADTGATQKSNLSATGVGRKQIDDLNASDENLGRGRLFNECRWLGMDRRQLGSLNRTPLIDRFTRHVHDTTKRTRANGNLDGETSVLGHCTANETFGTCSQSQISHEF
jgi:hypothetical protein